MILKKVVKAQIAVERCMSEILEARGKDPKHFFYTADKIKECKEDRAPLVNKDAGSFREVHSRPQ